MTAPQEYKSAGQARFQEYIQKIATGPRQSKDLSKEEAYDAMMLILNGEISSVRSAIFLIAIRMKRETLEENMGIWKALDATTQKHHVKVEKLLQVAEPFDGFNRTPCFGFYSIPVLAQLGLPCYGHSSLTLPPKHGVTFQEILQHHYNISHTTPMDLDHLEQRGFCYIGLHQSHPKLETLRKLREEMVKRSALATFEKMLMPLSAQQGTNVLATTYFHKGYEVPMIAVAKLSKFEKTIFGNGLESTTLFGVHKTTPLFSVCLNKETGAQIVEKKTIEIGSSLDKKDAERVQAAYMELKAEKTAIGSLTNLGEQALKNGSGPASPLISWQAGSLAYLSGSIASSREGFQAAEEILKKGVAYSRLMAYIERGLKVC